MVRDRCAAAVALVLSTLLTCGALAETPSPRDEAQQARIDLAVPDAPAFVLLEPDSSRLLRPGAYRELAVLLDPGATKNFSVEFAPLALVTEGAVDLARYRRSRIAYNTRFSIATRTIGEGLTAFATGLRMSLYDGSDLLLDKQYFDRLYTVNEHIADVRNECRREITAKIAKPADLTDQERLERDRDIDACAEAKLGFDSKENPDDYIDRVRNEAKTRNWNQPVLELASGLAGTTADGSASSLKIDRYAGWLTGGLPLGGDGQVLVGLSGLYARGEQDSVFRGGANLGIRGYFGSQFRKGMIEANAAWKDTSSPVYGGTAGLEIRLIEGIWADFGAGLESKEGENPRFKTHFSIRYSTLVNLKHGPAPGAPGVH